ncbi:site-2 protease family protein [Aphanizomenon flos-aquae NRERC-008]|jgi:membrane-associated protease RseP (regulator of RpoE activity)|uniref:Site-2 protease family protein n=2 Tax=Aphanizomenon flos-aquae TaxID=1176 RepID=A0ABR8ITG9_APHFL|nr:MULTISPECIES: site-2 protease family protein [Aphanizomenon]MBO1043709.1 site-2 protease family protein [Aphanizomenon flos-aquae UKL13-PB]MBO1059828.1 site-2 protease family protein [Aphanizomenon flos-aquae CP01]MCE2904460.1 site-2 protease family protein [Anabaena sp. CoA2_C59]MDJ0503657.1 site-2 protease family protein [Nostocales cyanobacterium LE14-WE12]OBQ27102.1 MAG: peptidase M50 [Aphanizomenon flos-aquae LD13]HCQ22138.1 site-2 protease family protein [Anabaena sp. UBA12330]
MFNSSETPIIAAIVLIASGILGWGFYRARPFGKLGILAWLQSVVLMTPWLLFFGLFAAGIYINIVGILFLVVTSAGLYIFLGRKLREAGQDAILKQRATDRLAAQSASEGDKDSSVATEQQLAPTPIPEADLSLIRGIFGIDTFFATETIPYQEGVVFKGNLRGEPEAVHNRLTKTLQERLDDKYRLFLVENTDGKPVMIVLPSRTDPQRTQLGQKAFAVILLIATIATSLEVGGILQNFDLLSNPERFVEALPIALGLFVVLIAHEIGHWLLARRHQVRLSWPFFLPAVQVGSFGAITRFESLVPSRKALFDIALAGPAFGGITSLLLLVIGLLLSHPGSLFQLPNQFFQGSILVGSLARVVLGSALHSPVVNIHPLVIIGWLGLVITALNLMPAGQLDGGRIVQAIYGRKTAGRTTFATIVLLGIVSLGNPLAMYWAIVILFLQRDLERPSLNEITEPDDARAALCLLALFLMIATLLPLTPALAGRLGIGS